MKLPEGSTLEVELEKELGVCFPDRDLKVAIIGSKVPQSTSKDVYIVQRLTERWGYLDITERSQLKEGDVITLSKVTKTVRSYCIHSDCSATWAWS